MIVGMKRQAAISKPSLNIVPRASLTHGTPPRISRLQFDVPLPTLEYLNEHNVSEARVQCASIYIAFVSLTDVLDQHLQSIYHIEKEKIMPTSNLELSLNNWVDSLSGSVRLVIIRGTRLGIPGAANLRLAYLTARLLLQRLQLEADKQIYTAQDNMLINRYIEARRTCEDILILTQELQPKHLGDFWLSVGAFAFPTMVNFLLRCALETEKSPESLSQSASFKVASDLITTLRSHQENHNWDLGDICLGQHAEIIERVLSGAPDEQSSVDFPVELQDFALPDASVIDQFFPSLWDPLQNF